jgi:hypothetical protein
MKFLLYTLLLIFGVTVFSVDESYAQQQKKPKKKYQSLNKTRRKSTGYQRKKQNFRDSQSRNASDFRSSEPPTNFDQSRQQSQTAKFKGNTETYGTPSVDKTQATLARFKSKLRIKQKRLSDPTPSSTFKSGESPTAVDKSIRQSKIAKFKGNTETYGTPSVEKTQATLARFKSKLRIKQKRLSDPIPLSTFRGGEASLPPTNYAQREINQQQMSKYRGETNTDLNNRKQAYETSAYKRSKFIGERALSRAYKKQQYEFSAYKRSIFLGEKILSRKSKIQEYELSAYKRGKFIGEKVLSPTYRQQQYELSAYKRSIFLGEKILSRKSKIQEYELSAYKRSKFIGEKVLSPTYRQQQYELSAYKREKFLGEKILSAKYRRQMQEMSAIKRSQFMGERIRINRPDNPYPTFVYQKSRIKRSFAQKEKFRKRMLKRINRNKIKQIPPSMRIPRKPNRNTVPAYDVNESEIWAKSRELDGSEAKTESSKPKGLKGLFRKKQKPKEEDIPVPEEPMPEK